MPTLFSHPVVAAGLAPAFRRHGVTPGVVFLGALCTVIPDLDVLGFRLGVPYGAPLGHRGFSHSLFFAAMLAALLTATLRRARGGGTGFAVFAYLFLCTASHGFLDAFTDGGRGVAFLAPFSNERFFFPWRPIVVSPLSVSQFLAGDGLQVLRSELVWVLSPWLLFSLSAWYVHARVLRPVRAAQSPAPDAVAADRDS